ncbi:hypothetical protein GS504_15940 [Rhodococcus hoagii]|nr:hypothetical protein [Prescottella equi]NKR94273.1 hypothetical protein [Prescottella equi]NKS58944.1 hypothetical protein [Prescottella equi]NKS69382.1 hypothetical protein [Prescottella equi]
MTPDQIIELLQVVASYDNRNPDRYMIASWLDASQMARWQSDDAFSAVRQHFANSTDWIMPGHVTAIIRQKRSGPAPFAEVVALPAAPPARAELRAQLRDGWRELRTAAEG